MEVVNCSANEPVSNILRIGALKSIEVVFHTCNNDNSRTKCGEIWPTTWLVFAAKIHAPLDELGTLADETIIPAAPDYLYTTPMYINLHIIRAYGIYNYNI
jgi:hypothetical protein